MNQVVLLLRYHCIFFGQKNFRWYYLLLTTVFLALARTDNLQAQSLVITEFMAANDTGEKDEDADYSDWIEIYNADHQAASLGGWYLTDDAKNLRQWQFPQLTIPGQGFVVVFASGKDRRDPKRNLHTNFQLNRRGEYLALVCPDGQTIASAFAPTYPPQISDVAYGRSMVSSTEWLVPTNATGRLWAPEQNSVGLKWTQLDFNDTDWLPVTLGIGYDRASSGSMEPPEPVSQLKDVTQPGDVLVPTSANSPSNEGGSNAIDNNPSTKYLNFDTLNAGFKVTPAVGLTVITGLRLTSANDAPDRDPTSFVLSGSNDGRVFTEIARGKVPDFTGRFVPVEVAFTNRMAYTQYQLLFPTVRNASAAVAVQIAEVEFLGRVGPATADFSALIQSNVESLMFGQRASAYLRIPFTVQQARPRENLVLRMCYDDGFIAYLNGVEVARANVPSNPTDLSVAVTNHLRSAAVREERFNLSAYATQLHTGANVLAIRVFNDGVDSPDLLLHAQLENTQVTLGNDGHLPVATPGAVNAPVDIGLVSPVVFDRPRGFYENPLTLTLHCQTAETTIRYTTNGSIPNTTNGVTYTAPITVDRTTVVRAIAMRPGWRSSPVITHTYLFLNDIPAQNRQRALAAGFPASWNGRIPDYDMDPRVIGSNGQDKYGGKYTRSIKTDLQSLPAMSIVMEMNDMFGPQGIYANSDRRGLAWEKAASLELINPGQAEGFQADAGIRIQGGAFRGFNLTQKKSFRVIFRKQYGQARLHFPLFGTEAAGEFQNFVLRANSNDAWPYDGNRALYIRDTFALDTMRAMGRVASHSDFVHLFINGWYWGLYNPVERPDAAFSATYFGGKRSSWDAINQDSVPDGNYDAWNRLLAQLSKGMASNEALQRVQGKNPDGTTNSSYEHLLDTENLIDYMILNFYVGNTDWPGRNWWVGRNRDNGDGFHFYPWDTETALGISGVDADVTGVADAVARPYAALKANPEFRLQFADRVYRHFFNGGALYVNPAQPKWDPAHPEYNRPAARFAALADKVSRAIVAESARWGDQMIANPYTRDEHWQKERDNLLANYFPRRSSNVLAQFRRAGMYPKTDAPTMNQHGGQVAPGFKLALSAAQGAIYYTTNGSDPRAAYLSGSASAIKYSTPLSLEDLATVRTRVLNGTEWSALNEATFVVGSPALSISELHYHPANPTATEQAAGFTNADDFEFLELHNPGATTYNLAGAHFISGIQFDFSNSAYPQLLPGHYVLLVKNRAAFEKRYGAGLPIAGEYTGQLNNAGERIELVNGQNETVLDFTYGTSMPWSGIADGLGPSLEVIAPQGDLNSATNWRASSVNGGSPGRANPAPPLALKIITAENEALRFNFEGKAGTGYTVYVSHALNVEPWQVYQSLAPLGQDQTIEIQVDLALHPKACFFKVSRQ